MVRTRRLSSKQVALILEGTFDTAEAWRVHDVLAHLAYPTRVSLDFREVRAFHDFAIALLAKDILSMRGYIEVAGLCQHQRRILKYFGVDETGLGESLPADSSEPAPSREDEALRESLAPDSREPAPPREDAALGA